MRRTTLQSIALALVVMAGITAIGHMGYRFYLDELYPAPPPEAPDVVSAPVEARAERAVIVVVDALREDVANEVTIMPELDRIGQTGRRGVSITQPVTMTLLSVLNLGTGKTPGLSWSVHNFQADTFPDESLFYWAHAYDMGVAFNGDAAWSQLFGPWAQHAVTFTDDGFYAEFQGALTKKDRLSIEGAREVLADPETWPVVVLHLTSTDKVSHTQGALMHDPDTGELTVYAETAAATDEILGQLFDEFHRPDQDLWLITSDHGATDTGNHGGGEDVTRRAPFVLTGAGVEPGAYAEVALNSWAATLSVALGLPVPRTAEIAANYDLIGLDAGEREAAHAAHLARRREFVEGVAANLGATDDDVQLAGMPPILNTATAAAAPPVIDELEATNHVITQLREHRRWMYSAALLLGIALQILMVVFVMRRRHVQRHNPDAGDERDDPEAAARARFRRRVVAGTAVAWLALMTGPLIFDHWLFAIVDILGSVLDGGWYLGRAALYLIGGTAALWGLFRLATRFDGPRARMLRTSGVWLLFGLVVVATSQIVVKWPFGPLSEAYLVMFAWLVTVGGAFAWRAGLLTARHWALAVASVASMIGVCVAWPDANMQLVGESEASGVLGMIAVAGAVAALTVGMVRREAAGRARIVAAASSALVVASSLAYRLMPEPVVAKIALLGLALAMAGIMVPWLSGRTRRDGIFVLALGLAHVMASDQVALLTVALAGLVFVVANLRLPKGSAWTPALLAGLVGLIDIGFFYILGYRFSFTAVDTRVVFMLDRTQIDLAASFVLITLQHSAPWLMLWAAVAGNRLEADDLPGLRTTFVAVAAVFVVRTWGAFFGMEFYLLNHWYVSHAVPMFVMEMAACGMATWWFAVTCVVLRDGWSGFGLGRLTSPAAAGRAARAVSRA